jgi:putative protein kinase ArgK-like GTPase of G3E family
MSMIACDSHCLRVPALLAPGAGKSAVLDALSTRLEVAGVQHATIEIEELARGAGGLSRAS